MTRALPIVHAAPGKKRLPLLDDVRPIDLSTRPIYAVWELTLRCDLACVHCGSRAFRARPDELTTAEAIDLVAQMAELGVREVSLIGGEAYLRPDWLEVVRAIRDRGMVASLTTGGLGLGPTLAREAASAGLVAASVSVDGLRATHDAVRNVEGSFDAALRALAALADAGIRITANTQLYRQSLPELDELFELLIARGIRGWQVQVTVAMGRAAETDDLLLEPYQMLELLPALARLKRRADEAKVLLWPGNNVGYFGPYERVLRGNQPHGHMSSCGAGRTTLGIESSGDIKGCPSLPTSDYVGGNIREHKLVDIWQRAAALRFTRERSTDELWGYCAGCYYADNCKAGCSWTAHSLFGKRGNNPYCHHRALELLARGERERVVRVALPPGEPFDHGRFEIAVEPWPSSEIERAREVAGGAAGLLEASPSSLPLGPRAPFAPASQGVAAPRRRAPRREPA